MDIKELKQRFVNFYKGNEEDIRVYFAPGRVNLIGEHVDYNGGYVLPCAISLGTWLVARKIDEDVIYFASENFPYKATVAKKDWQKKHDNHWINYPLGVIDQFLKKEIPVSGLQLLYSGNLPDGAGLSSSASVEVVTAIMINDLFSVGLDQIELIKLSQRAENQFVGVNCGIMDQFASGMGKTGHAVYLDCASLKYEHVPAKLNGYKIVIANTNKPRKLVESKYNERRSECEKAVEFIAKKKPIKVLGELSWDEFDKLSGSIPDPIVAKRARHVVTEIDRTRKAIDSLKKGNIEEFGRYLNESHDSLRDDYEVTGKELDTLVEEARKMKGVIGSRMTGAGFGGCTISIVKASEIDNFIEHVGKNYQARTGYNASFYIAEISDGAGRVN